MVSKVPEVRTGAARPGTGSRPPPNSLTNPARGLGCTEAVSKANPVLFHVSTAPQKKKPLDPSRLVFNATCTMLS